MTPPNTPSPPIETLPYRPCVGVMLLGPQGRVFVGRRIDRGVAEEPWQMPQGGIDPGEDLRAAARRELAEEVGTDQAEILGELPEWLDYDLPPHLLGVALKGRYRGQRMKWFAMQFLGDDSDIDLGRHSPPEFDAWRWADIEDLETLIVAWKRPIYRAVVAAFRPLAQALARS